MLGEILERRVLDDGVELFVLGRELVARPGAGAGDVPPRADRRAARGGARPPLGHARGGGRGARGRARRRTRWPRRAARSPRSSPTRRRTPRCSRTLAARQLEAAIAHELGELAEDRRRRGAWEALLLRARGTRAEMPARALKDALADAGEGGLLQTLIARRDRVGLALRAAAGPWLLRKILPEARAIWEAARAGRWEEAEALRRAAAARLELRLDALFGLFDGDPPHAEAARRAEQFEKELTGGV